MTTTFSDTDTVPVSRQRLHDVLECLDVALASFELAASDLDVVNGWVSKTRDDEKRASAEYGLGAASDKIDTAHLLVKAARRSLDDAITADALITKAPTRSRDELVTANSYTLKVPPGSPPIPRLPLVMPSLSDAGDEARTNATDHRSPT